MIFYYPAPLANDPQSGSQVRPIKMLEAFRSLGYDVYQITGTLEERVEKIAQLIKNLSREPNLQYQFFYGESTTAPPIVRDKTLHIGRALYELWIFRQLRDQRIPLGLFYRDIHWKFDQYKNNVQWYKRLVSYPLFYYELYWYACHLNYLFLPSIEMRKAIPFFKDVSRIAPLPPGCSEPTNPNYSCGTPPLDGTTARLRLLYVGGIVPPLYDIRPVLRVVRTNSALRLTISCRKQEWISWRDVYGQFLSSTIHVIHAKEPELQSLYCQNDISLLFYPPHEYRSLTIPLKLMESLSFGVPVIVSGHTEAARFVQTERVGWVVYSLEEFEHLLTHLANNPVEIKKMRDRVLFVRSQHTWRQRAKQVADLLLNT